MNTIDFAVGFVKSKESILTSSASSAAIDCCTSGGLAALRPFLACFKKQQAIISNSKVIVARVLPIQLM